jgi:MFS family permease
MLTTEQVDRIRPKLNFIQMIVLAIVLGAVAFAAVVAAIVDWSNLASYMKMMSLIGMATGAGMFAIAFIVPSLIAETSTAVVARELSNERREIDDNQAIDSIISSLSISQIIFFAIVEGAVFLNLLTFMLEHSKPSLIIVGLGLLIMLIAFPTKSRLQKRVANRLQAIKDELRVS